VALDWSSNAIAGLNIYGFSFEQTWNGITFSSKTAFDTDNSCLFGTGGKTVTESSNKILVKVPATGLYTESEDPCCEVTDVNMPSVSATDGTGYYDTWCIYTEKYVVWEAFSVEIDGDSCCGGAFDLTVDTYFGDKLCLSGWAWEYQYFGNGNDIDLAYAADIDLPGVADTVIIGLAAADAPDPITELLDTYEEALTKKAYYYDAAEDTLFAWVQTDVDLEIGIGSAWTLTAGLSIDAYGWNSMSFGFGFEF